MLDNFNNTNITVFATIFFLTIFFLQHFYLLPFYCTTRSWARYKTKIRDVHELREHTVDEWDTLDQRIIDKSLESGERDFELLWLQKEDDLNISSTLTFCHCAIIEGPTLFAG